MDENGIIDVILGLRQLPKPKPTPSDPHPRIFPKDRHVEVFYYYCQHRHEPGLESGNKLHDKIGDKMGVGGSTVRVTLNKILADLVDKDEGPELNKKKVDADPRVCEIFSDILPIVEGRPRFHPWPPPDYQRPQLLSQQEIEDTIVEGLRKLNPIEVAVLKLSFKENLSYSQAAETLKVSREHIESVVKAIETNLPTSILEQSTRDRIVELLYEIHPEQQTTDSPDPPIDDELPSGEQPPPLPPITPPSDRPRRTWGALIVAISLCAICAISIVIFRLVTQPDNPQNNEATMNVDTSEPGTAFLATQTSEETATPAEVASNNLAATNEALQANVIALQQTMDAQSIVSPEVVTVVTSPTPLPTTPGPSPTPTDTPKPTETPVPTSTNTPIVLIPFRNVFTDGLDEIWEIESGDYVIDNGVLKPVGGNLILTYPRNFPRTYAIEIGYGSDGVVMTLSNELVLDVGGRSWRTTEGQGLAGFGDGAHYRNALVRLEVDGPKYRVFKDSKLINELIYKAGAMGPIQLEFHPGGFGVMGNITSFEVMPIEE